MIIKSKHLPKNNKYIKLTQEDITRLIYIGIELAQEQAVKQYPDSFIYGSPDLYALSEIATMINVKKGMKVTEGFVVAKAYLLIRRSIETMYGDYIPSNHEHFQSYDSIMPQVDTIETESFTPDLGIDVESIESGEFASDETVGSAPNWLIEFGRLCAKVGALNKDK